MGKTSVATKKNHCAKKTVFLSCAQSKWHRTCERGGGTMSREEKEGRPRATGGEVRATDWWE
jgi:hypothetical protein